MSLTNAISAIAVVGSIVLAGRAGDRLHHDSRRGGGVRLDDQHRQRLPVDRSDAQDVQEAGACQVMNMDNIIQPIYLVSAILFILSLMWMNHPSTARRGVFCRRRRHGGRHRRHAPAAGNPRATLDRHRHGVGLRSLGIPLAMVPLTAVPQRTALSHAFGGLAAGLVGAAEFYLWITSAATIHEPLPRASTPAPWWPK